MHLKLRDAVDRRKWSEMIRGNWSDCNSNSDVISKLNTNYMFLVPAHPG